MTLEDLADKMESRFDKLDCKVDSINTVVAVHTSEIAAHDRENQQNHREHDVMKTRLDKLERWMWFTLGGGLASGAGLAKLFM